MKQLEAAAPDFIKFRASAENSTGGFLNLFGVSSSFNKTKNDTYVAEAVDDTPLRTPAEREAYILEKAQKYLKENPNSRILDIINSK